MNVQKTIIKGIKEQLFFNDYLVLPNFGGFVLKSKPSHFSATGGRLVPPSKTLSFNVQLKQNDGILALWLQNTLNCSADEAQKHLNDFSEFCAGILNAKRRLSLEGIGFFYLDFENNISFEPQQDANFLASSFGLEPLSLKEPEPETLPEPEKKTVFVDRGLDTTSTRQVIPQIKIRRDYNRLITPLLLATLFISLLGLILNNLTIRGEMRSSLTGENYAGAYNPLNYPDMTILNSPAKKQAYVADANGIASIELSEIKKIAVKAVENNFTSSFANADKSKKQTRHPVTNGFEIVMGCFAIRENAQRMIHKLSDKGVHATITGQNSKGMYVVGKSGFVNKEEAIHKLLEMKELVPKAWIKKAE